jgi:hypothetical protein
MIPANVIYPCRISCLTPEYLPTMSFVEDPADAEPLLLSVVARNSWPWIWLGLGLLLVAGVFSAVTARMAGSARPQADVTVSLPLPVVEPLALRPVSADEAEQVNAATPFAVGPIPPAQPFRFVGKAEDLERATDCLAAAIHFEAGNETIAGQRAVAQVVLNRVRHPAYPKSVCGVVFQGSERATGCQFTFTCDGALSRIPTVDAWMRARARAQEMLGGSVYAPVGLATHYHTNWVLPAWSAKLEKIRAEGTHLFFRWSGWWGTPLAFRGTYAGVEPPQNRLSRLSNAHGALTTTDDSGLDTVATIDPNAPGNTTTNAAGQDSFILVISARTEPTLLAPLAKQTCGDRDYCKVMAWTDRAQAAKSFPIPDDRLPSVAFSYLRNKAQGFDKPLWNCAIFPRIDPKQCMRGRMQAALKSSFKMQPIEAVTAPETTR